MASQTYVAVGTACQPGHMSPGTLRLLHRAAAAMEGQGQPLQASQGLGQKSHHSATFISQSN